jgi:hypothetical protein
MTEFEKILVTAGVALVAGYIGGRAQAWHGQRRDERLKRKAEVEAFEQDYLEVRVATKNFDSEPRFRMKAFQELGAYRFSKDELEVVRQSIIARGFADPLCAHKESLGLLEGYPHSVFQWAKQHQANLGSIVSVLEKWIAIHESASVEDGSPLDQQLLNWRVTLEIWRRNESRNS